MAVAELAAAAGLLLVAALRAGLARGSSRGTAPAAGAGRPRRRSGSSGARPRPRRASATARRAAARRSAGRGAAEASDPPRASRRSAVRHLLLVALRLRRDREAHHRLGEADVRQLDRSPRASSEDVAGQRRPSASRRRRCRRSPSSSASGRAPCPGGSSTWPMRSLRVRARVDEVRVAADRPVQDAEDVDAAGERVGDRLEDERRGRRRRRSRSARPSSPATARPRRAGRAARVVPRFFVATPQADREHLAARHRVLERVRDLLGGELLPVEVALHQASSVSTTASRSFSRYSCDLLLELGRDPVGPPPAGRPGPCRRTCAAGRRCP